MGDTLFVILRYYDEGAGQDADDLRKLTNKVAVFVSEKYLITIHRRPESFLEAIKEKWTKHDAVKDPSLRHLFNEFVGF